MEKGNTQVASAMSVADIAAESDESISKKVCSESGETSYFRSSVDENGEKTLTEVKYCDRSNTFINLSPEDVELEDYKMVKVASDVEENAVEGTVKKKECSKKCKKTCTKKKSN